MVKDHSDSERGNRCRHIGYSFRLTARVHTIPQTGLHIPRPLLHQWALAGTRNSSMGPPHEGSIRQPIAPWANALPLSYIPLPPKHEGSIWRPIAPWANALPLSYVPLPPTHEGSIRRPIAPWANALTTELKNPSSYLGCLVSSYKVLIAQWVQPMKDRSDDPWANAVTTELQSGCVTFECAMTAWRSSEWWSARNSSMGRPWRIDPTTHRTMSERSYHGATERSGCVTFECAMTAW